MLVPSVFIQSISVSNMRHDGKQAVGVWKDILKKEMWAVTRGMDLIAVPQSLGKALIRHMGQR